MAGEVLGIIRPRTELLARIPAKLAMRYRVPPIGSLPGTLMVAISDPADVEALEVLHDSLQCELELVIAPAGQLDEFIQRFFGGEGKV